MKKILLGLFILLNVQQLFAQSCTNEKGYNDFPFTQNGLTVTASGTGSYRNYAGTYTSCGITTKANSIFLGSSTYTTAFSSAVNDVVYNIVGSDNGEAFTITVNNGTPTLSLIGGSCSGNWTISGNTLTAPSSVAGTVLQIHSTVPYTSVTISHPSSNGSLITLCMDGVLQSVSSPSPNLTVTNPAAVCAPTTVDLTATAITVGSDAGLTFSYYTDASAATALTNAATVTNSGTYYIKALNSNGGSVIKPVTVTINPPPTTANAGTNQNITTVTPASTTLNGNLPTIGTGLWSQISGPTTATIANTALYNTSVSNLSLGTYTFRWSISNSCGTSTSDVSVAVVGTQTITFNALTAKTYGDVDFSLTATASSGLAVSYSSSNTAVATVNATGLVHIIAAGTTVITASQPGDGNYDAATPVTQNLTVNKASLNITADNQSKTYGDANPVLTASYSGFVNGDTKAGLSALPIISTTATTTSPVGAYPITVAGAASDNYSISYGSGMLSVFPGIQIITFNSASKTYGDPDFSISATASSGLPVTYSSSNTAVATVDAQGMVHIVSAGTVTITALQAGNSNYIATTSINQQIVINRAPLTITADNQTKTYGAANPALTVSYTGFVNGDTPASLTAPPTTSTTAIPASALGVYPIAVSGAIAANYDITYKGGLLTIVQSTQTITFSALPAKTYGDADFAPGATSDNSTIAITYTSDNPAVATIVNGNIHIVSAGTVTITASQAGNNNYTTATDVAQTLTINKAPLNLTADNLSKVYGEANPALTVTYTGFVNGETASVLTSAPAISTTATAASGAGTYPITVTVATASNYNITYTAGTLTITKAALTITADNNTRAYGTANPAFTVTYSGFVNGDNQTSLAALPTVSTTATTASAAGVYPITATGATSANYAITYVSGNLTVTNAIVNSVTLTQVTVFENQPAGTMAATLSAASLDPSATYTYSLVTGSGSTDNDFFQIQGNKLVTAKSLDYEQKNIYSVLIRATNQYGLYLDQTFAINLSDVNEAPTLAVIANQTVCATNSTQNIPLSNVTDGPETGQNITLNVSSTDPGLFTSLQVSAVSSGKATLSYVLARTGLAVVTVTVQDNGSTANGGTDSFSQTFTITANELPTASVSADKTQILKGETVTLTAAGGSTYSWDTTPNVSGTSSSAVIAIRPSQTTTYQVTVSNASGCSSTKSITIQVTEDYQNIEATNILTPNGDGKNDTWVVKNIDLYPGNTVLIFDKGGRKLVEIKNYKNDWDGSFHGSPLTEGTYYYVIDFGDGKAPKKGFITILRNR